MDNALRAAAEDATECAIEGAGDAAAAAAAARTITMLAFSHGSAIDVTTEQSGSLVLEISKRSVAKAEQAAAKAEQAAAKAEQDIHYITAPPSADAKIVARARAAAAAAREAADDARTATSAYRATMHAAQ